MIFLAFTALVSEINATLYNCQLANYAQLASKNSDYPQYVTPDGEIDVSTISGDGNTCTMGQDAFDCDCSDPENYDFRSEGKFY